MKTALKRTFSLFFVAIFMFCMVACAPSEPPATPPVEPPATPPVEPPTLTMADVFEVRCWGCDELNCSPWDPSPHCTIEDLMREDNTHYMLDTEYIVTKYDIRITSLSNSINNSEYLQGVPNFNGEYNAGDIINNIDSSHYGAGKLIKRLVIEFELL